MGKKDASANRGTPVEQYRKDIGITYTLFLICFCRDMSIIIVIEFVYKYPLYQEFECYSLQVLQRF